MHNIEEGWIEVKYLVENSENKKIFYVCAFSPSSCEHSMCDALSACYFWEGHRYDNHLPDWEVLE